GVAARRLLALGLRFFAAAGRAGDAAAEDVRGIDARIARRWLVEERAGLRSSLDVGRKREPRGPAETGMELGLVGRGPRGFGERFHRGSRISLAQLRLALAEALFRFQDPIHRVG